MVTIIIYDIKGATPTEYARNKRKFYYHLNKIKEGFTQLTESTLQLKKGRNSGKNKESLLKLLESLKPHVSAYIIDAKTIKEI